MKATIEAQPRDTIGTDTMKNTISAATALLCLGSVSAASAGPTLFIGPAITDFGAYENVDPAFSGKTSLGWHFEHIPVLVEASYLKTGKHDIEDVPAARNLRYEGGDVAIGGGYRNEKLGLFAWGKGGYYFGRTTLETAVVAGPSDISANTDGFMGGLGVMWNFTPWAAVRLDIDFLFEVRDFNQNVNNSGRVNDDDESTLSVTTLGIVFTLPGGRPAATPRAERIRSDVTPAAAAEAAPAPVVEPASPAAAMEDAEPVPGEPPATAPFTETAAPIAGAAVTVNAPLVTRSDEEAVAPAAATPPRHAVVTPVSAGARPTRSNELGTHLRVSLKTSTELLSRPVVGADVDASAPRDSVATLGRRVTNASGTWWFITTGKLSGWVPEEALLHIP